MLGILWYRTKRSKIQYNKGADKEIIILIYEYNISHSSWLCGESWLGNHKLQIETGRFTVPQTPVNIRYCPHCKNFVEDEIHFLLKCTLYNDSRNEFFVKLADSYKIFTSLSDAEKIIFIFSSTDGNVSRLCASFL